MLNYTWNRVTEWFSDLNERSRLIKNFNRSAKEAFVGGIAPTYLKAKISRGESTYKHQFSSWLKSGFRVQALTGRELTKEELVLIGTAILSDGSLVRRLVVLGFDTLEVHGDEGNYGCRWQLKDHILLQQ